MKAFFSSFFLLAALCAMAQPISVDATLTFRTTGADTVEVQAKQTFVFCDMGSGSYTVRLPAPSSAYLGLGVTFTQFNAGALVALTVATVGGGSDFYAASSSLSTGYTHTVNSFQSSNFTCLETAGAVYKWVRTN